MSWNVEAVILGTLGVGLYRCRCFYHGTTPDLRRHDRDLSLMSLTYMCIISLTRETIFLSYQPTNLARNKDHSRDASLYTIYRPSSSIFDNLTATTRSGKIKKRLPIRLTGCVAQTPDGPVPKRKLAVARPCGCKFRPALALLRVLVQFHSAARHQSPKMDPFGQDSQTN